MPSRSTLASRSTAPLRLEEALLLQYRVPAPAQVEFRIHRAKLGEIGKLALVYLNPGSPLHGLMMATGIAASGALSDTIVQRSLTDRGLRRNRNAIREAGVSWTRAPSAIPSSGISDRQADVRHAPSVAESMASFIKKAFRISKLAIEGKTAGREWAENKAHY